MNESDKYKIVSEYEHTLFVPKDTTTHPFILAPVGLVAAGKTTVITPLSKQFSLVRISSDEIRSILKKKQYEYTQNDVLWILEFLLKKYLGKGYGVTIDSNCEQKEGLVQQLEKEYGIKTIWIHINPPESFIIHKLENLKYEPGHVFKNATQAIVTYFKDKPEHRNLTMPFISTLDTSRSDIEEQIQETAEKIINTLDIHI